MGTELAKPAFKISLAQWTINRELRSGKIDNLDFAKVAHDHGIRAIEYVNQFFMDKAKDRAYLGQMKQRAVDLGVKSLLIMCDREGRIGDTGSGKTDSNGGGPSKVDRCGQVLGVSFDSRQCRQRWKLG